MTETLLVIAIAIVFLVALAGVLMGMRNRGSLDAEQRTMNALKTENDLLTKKVRDLEWRISELEIALKRKQDEYVSLLEQRAK